MKIIKTKYKCAICGKENEYSEYLSMSVRGEPDFDMKPNENSPIIGANIMECPNCHYSNYQINESIEERFKGNLKLWKESTEIQDIIENNPDPLRKILLVATQYENNRDYIKSYKTYIMASWICEKSEESEFRNKAIEVFAEKVLPRYNEDLLQIADILRMEEEFEDAKIVINSIKELSIDEKIGKIINAEKEFIINKDSKRHNLKEIKF